MASSVRCSIFDLDGVEDELTDSARLSDILVEPDMLVWLDVVGPQERDFELLREEFGLHPLAIEDAVKANQRPKVEQYGDVWFFVVNAAGRYHERITAQEIAVFLGINFVITVRPNDDFAMDEARARWQRVKPRRRCKAGVLLFTIFDTVVDGYLPVAEALEEQVDNLDTSLLISGNSTEEILLKSFRLKKDLNRFRRICFPMQALMQPILRGDLPAIGDEVLPYFRDVSDHITRALGQIDDAREQITNARETHVALVSHRQNEVARQLTLIATIFLPLTFITGFFGQNFSYLTNAITSAKSFWWLGIGTEVAAVAVLLGYFRYKHWR